MSSVNVDGDALGGNNEGSTRGGHPPSLTNHTVQTVQWFQLSLEAQTLPLMMEGWISFAITVFYLFGPISLKNV